MKRKIPTLITLLAVIFFGVAFLAPFSAGAASALPPLSENTYLAKTPPKPSPKSKPKPKPAPAPKTTCDYNSGCDLVATYVNPLVNLLSVAFGLIAVISLIMGGIQYSASQGDPQKSAQAKSRISNTLIAVFAYMFLYAFFQFLIPGGLFH